MQIGKEEATLPLFAKNMLLYLKDPMGRVCCKAVLGLSQKLCGSDIPSLADSYQGLILFVSWLFMQNSAHMDAVHTQPPTITDSN